MINNIVSKITKNSKKTKVPSKDKHKYKYTFCRDFIIGIFEIEKKQIDVFIKSEAVNYLGTDDFYYGYFHKHGKLYYVAHKSNKDESGKISRLAYILANEGNFYIIDDKSVFRFIHKDGNIKQSVDYIENVDSDEVSRHKITNLEHKELHDVPETLKLKWSLTSKNLYIGAFSAVIFIFAMAFYALNAKEYSLINKKAIAVKNQLLEAEKAKAYEPIADLSQIIKKMAAEIKDRGTIISAKGQNNEMVFTIQMKTENDARTFLKEMGGGTYENGKVIFAAKYTANK